MEAAFLLKHLLQCYALPGARGEGSDRDRHTYPQVIWKGDCWCLVVAPAERLPYLVTAALCRHTTHTASGGNKGGEWRSFVQSDSLILQLGRKKKKHPLSVSADLVSVTLALRLPGKQKWAQTQTTHTQRTRNSWTQGHTWFQTMTTHDGLQPVDFRIQHDFRWMVSASYFKS